MKGRNPTVAQKKILTNDLRLDCNERLVQKRTPEYIQIVNRVTKEVRKYTL